MIHELIQHARNQHLQPGDCVEVHVCGDDPTVFRETTTIGEFFSRWGYALEIAGCPSADRSYIGIVHAEGAYVTAL